MATVFFQDVFGNEVAPRVMSGVIALSLFGNIVVMTFTASRGKDFGFQLSFMECSLLMLQLLYSETGDSQGRDPPLLSILR